MAADLRRGLLGSGVELIAGHPAFSTAHRIDNPYLKPVQIDGGPEVLPGFSFEIEGSFAVDGDLTVSAALEQFSVPPFEIVGTGLVLALDECRLITKAGDVGSAITDLGFDQGFRGLHAGSALIHWLLPLQLQSQDLPGLRANFENIALGNQGVSVSARLSWPVVYQGGQFDPAQTEILGYFFDPEWTFALASLNVGIQANIPNAMGAAGHVRIPFLDAIFALELFTAYAGEDDYQLQGTLSLGDGETVAVPLGDDDYQVELQGLRISGRLQGEDEFNFSGSTSFTIDLPGISVATDTAALTLEHRPDSDVFRLQLTQVEIENIGSVGESELSVVTRVRKAANRSWHPLNLRRRWSGRTSPVR